MQPTINQREPLSPDGHPWHKTFGLHVGLCVERLNRARNYSRQRRHTSDKGQKITFWL
jgi:hypothetical protein